jgi:hypothetical protein
MESELSSLRPSVGLYGHEAFGLTLVNALATQQIREDRVRFEIRLLGEVGRMLEYRSVYSTSQRPKAYIQGSDE